MFNWISELRAFLKIRQEVYNIMDEIKTVKPGWRTSEFWLVLAGGIATIASAAAPLIPAAALPYIAGVSLVLPAIYTVARTIVKLTPSKADDAFLDNLAAKLAPLIKLDKPAAPPVDVPKL